MKKLGVILLVFIISGSAYALEHIPNPRTVIDGQDAYELYEAISPKVVNYRYAMESKIPKDQKIEELVYDREIPVYRIMYFASEIGVDLKYVDGLLCIKGDLDTKSGYLCVFEEGLTTWDRQNIFNTISDIYTEANFGRQSIIKYEIVKRVGSLTFTEINWLDHENDPVLKSRYKFSIFEE